MALRFSTLPAILCVLASVAPVRAQIGVVPWIGATARFGTYAMDDVNADIRNVDAMVTASFDEITSGFGFGAAAGLKLPSGLNVSVHYERLRAASDVADPTGSLKYDFAANAYYGALEYTKTAVAGPAFGVGAGAGMVQSAGSVELSATGLGAVSGDVGGSGPLFQVYGVVNLTPQAPASVVGMIGYRHAKANSVELDGVPIQNADGSSYDVDYSGLLAEVSLRVRLS